MLCNEGRISILCFALSSCLALFCEIILRIESDVFLKLSYGTFIVHAVTYGLLSLFIFLSFRGFSLQVAMRSTLLGYVFASGILVYALTSPTYEMFGVYMSTLSAFHYFEFLTIAWTNPKSLTIDCFILNHSLAYGIAAGSSWLEFFTERYFFPAMKIPTPIAYFGLVVCILGDSLRKLAMITARHNFNHIVQYEKADDHQLVTHGIYKLCRHPSYVGWFYWSIGTQLVLQNPICTLAYAITSWRFFNERILVEELTLLEFFGESYMNYQKEVGTGLPFIKGYKIQL